MASIRALGPRRWQLRWYVGQTPEGRERYAYETFTGSKREAERRWAEEDARRRQVSGVDAARLTVAEFCARWMADHKVRHLRASTSRSYTAMLDHYVVPTLGARRLSKLTVLDVQAAVRTWEQGPRYDGRPGHPGPRTVHYALTVLRASLQDAVRWQLIPQNPASLAQATPVVPHQRVWWSADQAALFLAQTTNVYGAIAWQLALLTGLREAEILGLRWQDIEWEERALRVRQIRLRHADSPDALFGPPKTARSARTLALAGATITLLRAHRQAQRLQRIAAGPAWQDCDLVVATGLGTPWSDSNVRRAFYAAIAQVPGIPRITFHDLRHTHASLLRAQGTDIRVIADRLGHVQVSFTLQTYAHADLNDQRTAADQLHDRLRS